MNNKIIKWTILSFLIIILLIYSESILTYGKKLRYRQQGYAICNTYNCMNDHMQKCEKAFLNINSGFKWIDMFVQGYKDQKCVYQVNRYTGDGYICSFGGEVFSKKLVDELFGVHNGLRNEIIKNCEPTIINK
jgi:hypothetical protein